MANRLPYEKTIGGTIYVRLVIPPALQPFANNQKNIYRQIGSNRQEAKRNHARALASAQDEMDSYRRIKAEAEGVQITRVSRRYAEMTPDQMAREHYRSRLAFDDQLRDDPRYAASPINDELVQIVRDIKAGRGTDEEIAQALGGALGRFRARGNTDAEPGSPKWRGLARTIASAEYEALSRAAERDEGDFTGKPEMPALLVDEPDLTPTISIQTLFETYLKHLAAAGKGAATAKRWKPVVEHLIKFAGGDDANLVTEDKAVEWIDELLLVRKLAPKTVRDVNLAAAKSIFGFAKERRKVALNPFVGLKVRGVGSAEDRDKWFSEKEASVILTAVDAYQPKASDNPQTREALETTAAKRWIPWLCAHTGSRPREMAQLRKRDIREEDGIHFIHITPYSGSVKSGKFRDVPIHPQLIERGFLKFVDDAADGPLFFKADTKRRQGASHPGEQVSQLLAEWLQSLKVIPEGVWPQYGWRHRFKRISRELRVDPSVYDALQGHAPKSASDLYGGSSMITRKEVIDRYPRIEIHQSSSPPL